MQQIISFKMIPFLEFLGKRSEKQTKEDAVALITTHVMILKTKVILLFASTFTLRLTVISCRLQQKPVIMSSSQRYSNGYNWYFLQK